MFRFTRLSLRTSPKSPGSWTMPKFTQNPSEEPEKIHLDDIPMEGRSGLTLDQLTLFAGRQMFYPTEFDTRSLKSQNSAHKARLRADLKNFDKRWQTDQHDSLAKNTLKSITELHGPSGKRFQRDFLRGKIVGILLFSESERSERFMHILQGFAKKNSPDFVVVSISQCSREQMHVSHQHGFYHLPQSSNTVCVLRDLGFTPSFLSPLPRLYIVDGTSGHCISNRGLDAVLTKPDTSMKSWAEGFQGLDLTDRIKARFML